MRAAWLLAGLLALLPAPAAAAGVERFREYLRSTQTAQADFEQQVFDRDRKLVQRSRGSFTLQRPGRFRWSYAQPYAQLIVGDGKRVWIYDEDLNQVTVRAMAKALGSTPAALLAGAADVERAFELSDAGTREGLEWVEAKPREREAGFERIRLGLGTVGVQAMELTDHFGQTTLLRFTNIARNPRVDPDAFRFIPPKGADVLGE
ncbi:MAG TPA: outer membrane lipoprotein chaperone LolA [Burkholderiales bacterium]